MIERDLGPHNVKEKDGQLPIKAVFYSDALKWVILRGKKHRLECRWYSFIQES